MMAPTPDTNSGAIPPQLDAHLLRNLALSRAHIDEEHCIGCTLCIKDCPVDAIIGAAKQMHTIIDSYCIGCELCLAACPVDCIRMLALVTPTSAQQTSQQHKQSRQRFAAHALRVQRDKQEKEALLASRRASSRQASNEPLPAASPSDQAAEQKKAMIAAAMLRARTQRAAFQATQQARARGEEPSPSSTGKAST